MPTMIGAAVAAAITARAGQAYLRSWVRSLVLDSVRPADDCQHHRLGTLLRQTSPPTVQTRVQLKS